MRTRGRPGWREGKDHGENKQLQFAASDWLPPLHHCRRRANSHLSARHHLKNTFQRCIVIAGKIGGLLVNCKHSIRTERAAGSGRKRQRAAAAANQIVSQARSLRVGASLEDNNIQPLAMTNPYRTLLNCSSVTLKKKIGYSQVCPHKHCQSIKCIYVCNVYMYAYACIYI